MVHWQSDYGSANDEKSGSFLAFTAIPSFQQLSAKFAGSSGVQSSQQGPAHCPHHPQCQPIPPPHHRLISVHTAAMSKRSIVQYTQALVAAGVMETPSWMAALLRCRRRHGPPPLAVSLAPPTPASGCATQNMPHPPRPRCRWVRVQDATLAASAHEEV